MRVNNNFITGKGERKSNQDVVFVNSLGGDNQIYLIADGMGGYEDGAYAANFIVSNFFDVLKNQDEYNEGVIQSAIYDITKSLILLNKKKESKMGATLGGVIESSNEIHCFWLGDVKIWHVKNQQIAFESIDHNLKNELIQNKVFVESSKANKYNHVVTRAIQNDIKKVKIGYKCIGNFNHEDHIIMASDGVTDVLSNHSLLNCVNSPTTIHDKLSKIDDSLKRVAKDNYSLILIG